MKSPQLSLVLASFGGAWMFCTACHLFPVESEGPPFPEQAPGDTQESSASTGPSVATTSDSSTTPTPKSPDPCQGLDQVACRSNSECRLIGAAIVHESEVCKERYLLVGCSRISKEDARPAFAKNPQHPGSLSYFPFGGVPLSWEVIEPSDAQRAALEGSCAQALPPGYCEVDKQDSSLACEKIWTCGAATGDRVDLTRKCVERGIPTGKCYLRKIVPPASPTQSDWGEAVTPVAGTFVSPEKEIWNFRSDQRPDWPWLSPEFPNYKDIVELASSGPDCPKR